MTTPKQLRLALSPEDWRLLRVMAAQRDTSMQALVAAIVRREIASETEREEHR